MDQPDVDRSCGYLADSTFCFSACGRYVIFPCGASILVMQISSGRRIAIVEGRSFNGDALITSVERVPCSHGRNIFVSLDITGTVCIWALTFSEDSIHASVDLQSRFALCNLQFEDNDPDENQGNVLVRKKLTNVIVNAVDPKTYLLASLILVIICSLPSKEISSKPSCSELDDKPSHSLVPSFAEDMGERAEDPQDSSVNSVRPIVNVVAINVEDVLTHPNRQSEPTLTAKSLFYCTPQCAPSKTVTSSRSILKIATSGCFVVLVKDHSLFIFNRETNDLLSILHNNSFSSLALDASGKRLATGDAAGNVVWWRILVSHETVSVQKGNDGRANASRVKALQARFPAERFPSKRTRDVAIQAGLVHQSEDHQTLTKLKSRANVSTTEKAITIPASVQHWHSHPVRGLSFTSDGSHLISMGEEGVLVFWHESQSSRYFMPRFGAPIHGVASSLSPSNLIAITLADNSIRIIDSMTLSVVDAYFGLLAPLSLLSGGSLLPIAMRARGCDTLPMNLQFYSPSFPTTALVVASGVTSAGLGANSRIQIFNMKESDPLGHLTVNRQNYVSRTHSVVKKFQWTIQNTCMTPSGKQLATVEFRKSMFPALQDCLKNGKTEIHGSIGTAQGGGVNSLSRKSNRDLQTSDAVHRRFAEHHTHWSGTSHTSGRLYVLKFWSITPLASGQGISEYKMANEVSTPHTHDVSRLLCIASHTSQSLFDFMSISLDGTWKMWTIETHDNGEHNYELHITRSYRTLPCVSGSVSHDKSLLMVLHPGCVTVWDTRTYELKRVLGVPYKRFSLPMTRHNRTTWVESSVDSSFQHIKGELLLLAHATPYVLMWNLMSTTYASLAWVIKVSETAVFLPDIWGLPLFGVYYPCKKCVEVYCVMRTEADQLTGKVYTTIDLSSTTPMLFSVELCGSWTSPYLSVLDSNFEHHFFYFKPLHQTDQQRCVVRVKQHDEFHTTMGSTATPKHIMTSTQHEGQGSTEDIAQHEDNSMTQMLSCFVQSCQPLHAEHKSLHHHITTIVGQSCDGPSHLAATPSTFFNRMASLYAHDTFES